MKQITTTKFFRSLREASQSGIDKDAETLQIEYDDFAEVVFSMGSTTNQEAYHNTLVYASVEL